MNMPSDKYKIVFNKPELSDEEIDGHKDFDRILDHFERRHHRQSLHHVLPRINKLVPVLLLAVLSMVLLVFFLKKKEDAKKQQDVRPIPAVQSYMCGPLDEGLFA